MSENPSQQTESQTSEETKNTEHMIPKSRFDEVNNKLKQLQKQLEDSATQAKERETQTLAEQNRYKELYEQLLKEHEPLKQSHEKALRYQSALEASNQARLERVPEDKRSLIPEYDDPVRLGDWLDRNASLILEAQKPTAPKLDGASGSGGSARESASALPASLQTLAEIARQSGYDISNERVSSYARKPIKQDTGD